MYIVKKIGLLLVLVLAGFTSGICQSFEGKIIYKFSVETPDPKKVSQEQIDVMFKDMDTVAILYISKNRYKLVTMARETGHPRSINQYDPSANRIYQYMTGANEGFYTDSPNLEGETYKKKVSKKAGEVTLLDPNCSSIVITDAASESIVFFSHRFKVDPETIKVDAPLFLRFIREAGALPLKIIMSGGGAVHSLVYEATSIVEEELPDSEFPVPKKSRD